MSQWSPISQDCCPKLLDQVTLLTSVNAYSDFQIPHEHLWISPSQKIPMYRSWSVFREYLTNLLWPLPVTQKNQQKIFVFLIFPAAICDFSLRLSQKRWSCCRDEDSFSTIQHREWTGSPNKPRLVFILWSHWGLWGLRETEASNEAQAFLDLDA